MFPSSPRARFAACATLVALALAPAAHAQQLTLNSGDAVTVSGAGTAGTIGGIPVANNTSSYSTNNMYAVQTSGTAAFTLGTGGTLTATGQYDYGLFAGGSGPITISGGSISAEQSARGLFVNGSSPITITGGSITAGASGYGLYVGGFSSIDLYGAFDGLTPGQTQALPSNHIVGMAGSFTGTLQNNITSQTFTYLNYGIITLHNTGIAAAPEPSPIAALGVGLLGLGGLALRTRRRA